MAEHLSSAQVLLLSSPGLEEFYRCCMLFVDDMAEPRETPEHPLKQLKVRTGSQEARCAGWSVCPAPFSAARLLCINIETGCFRAEGPHFIQDSIEMLPLKRRQVAGLREWP